MCKSQQSIGIHEEEFVSTGCIITGSRSGLIRSTPLGSCVAVVAYDKTTKVGGIAHIMLPGISPKENIADRNKYAENAIPNLFSGLNKKGAVDTNIEISLIGGADVLKKGKDFIGVNLIFSIFMILKSMELKVIASSLGGYERRSASINLRSGVVNYTVGDSIEKELWKFTI